VKESLGQLFGLVKLSAWRESLGLSKLSGQSFHMRFLGNPGTGKTVVARIVGEMLTKMGVVTMPAETRKALKKEALEKLKKKAEDAGEKPPRSLPKDFELPIIFKEVSRGDLVATHVGQTAPKVVAAVQNSTGGVLFIDEAYAIVRNGADNFGQEAVDTLIKEMEDKREQVVVILAGYATEMDTFFDANPGFKSRVPLTFRFEDYSCKELTQIGEFRLASQGITLADGSSASKLENLIAFSTGCCDDIAAPECHPSRDNGNGRTVRNVVEALSRSMATRVMSDHIGGDEPISKQDLTLLKADDIEAVAEDQAALRLRGPCGRDGLLDQLRLALDPSSASGLRGWFDQYKVSSPVERLHKLVRETGRMSQSLTAFSSSDALSDLQHQCTSGLEQVVEALHQKALITCGSEDGSEEGLLKTLSKEIDPSKAHTVRTFKEAVSSIQVASTEALLIRKILSGDDLPQQLQKIEGLAGTCHRSIKSLLSKSILMPLVEAVGKAYSATREGGD